MSIVTRWATDTPDKIACRFTDTGETLTFAQLDRRGTQAAHWLIDLGLRAGDCVALLLDNGPAIFEMALAAELAGLYYVPLSTHLLAAEVAYILRDSATRLVVTARDKLGTLPEAAGLLVATVDGAPGTIDYEAALAGRPTSPVELRPIGRDILYSSGTTGQPKGIMRPMLPPEQRRVVERPVGAVATLGTDPDMVYLSTGPLYHAAPHRFTLQTLRNGGTCIVPRRFDAEGALTLIKRHRVSHSQWVPTMFTRLLALPQEVRSRYDVSSLRLAIHAAAPCSVPVKERMIAWWGPILFEYYSGSEGIGSTAIDSLDWLAHRGSVGRASAGTIHITDEDGRELPAGEVGQIWFSGLPGFAYLNAPEKTAAAIDPRGWATYGDIGHLDRNGYLYLSDRRADLILSGGVNIYPQEVENALCQHPAVADVAVIGVPDGDLGERVQAVVQVRPGADADAADLIAFCRERLAGPKCPRAVDFVEHVPRSDIGKLLRRVLKDRYRAAG